MQAAYVQNLRYKLQRRIRRLNASEGQTFFFRLKEFFGFFDSQPLLTGLAAELAARRPDYLESVEQVFARRVLFGETETESAAIGYGVLRRYSEGSDADAYWGLIDPIRNTSDQALEQFRTLYLEPFYEYFDEHLDDGSFVLHSLTRYKHACEWFRRDRLYRVWFDDTRRGERVLALDLYEYLHENGIEFHIEPSSVSGEADMVSLQQSADPLIADAKIFNPDRGKGKTYVIRGCHQLYRYACDYNQALAYLIIFNTSEKPLRFALQSGAETIPRVTVNHKTIFLLEIDIYPHPDPASRRKSPEGVEISEAEIAGTFLSDQESMLE